MKNLFLIAIVGSVLCGCVSMSAINVPGQTSASLTLKSDIINMINMIENAQAPGCHYKIIDTKAVGVDNGTFKEEWIVESCGKQVVYPVNLTPDPNGGTYFGVKTPEKR